MPERCCVGIQYAGRGPDDVICSSVEKVPKKCKTYYHPCPINCCDCPDIWPMLVPKVKCWKPHINIQNPPTCPVMPRCQSPRWSPSRCPKPRPQMSPERCHPPIIPCCKPCCPKQVIVKPRPSRVRCLDPVIPCCPPPCIIPPPPCYPPEPPCPPICPIFPPCICPDRPNIVHDSVRRFVRTSDCYKLKSNRDNPRVCFVPVAAEEMGQYNYHMGKCYCT